MKKVRRFGVGTGSADEWGRAWHVLLFERSIDHAFEERVSLC